MGYLVCTTATLVAHISKVAVIPQARRQGIASALIQVSPTFSRLPAPLLVCTLMQCWEHLAVLLPLQVAIAQSLATRGVQEVSLHVSASNAAAIQLYRQAGFDKTAVLADYYALGRPALKLSKSLTC